MKSYWKRILVCVIPVAIAAVVVAVAVHRYLNGEGGFKLGVDLAGGTILVYEVDPDKKLPDNYKPEELAAALKRRIDPADLYNVTIRPVSTTRVEIILPTGGTHQANIDEARWKTLLQKVQEKWPQAKDIDVERGRTRELAVAIQQALDKSAWQELLGSLQQTWPQLKEAKLEKNPGSIAELREQVKKAGIDLDKEKEAFDKTVKAYEDKQVKLEKIDEFIENEYRSAGKKKSLGGDDVPRIKELIKRVGSLEFRILANARDDKEAFEAARATIEGDPRATEEQKAERKRDLENRAARGLPPPPPKSAEGSVFRWSNKWANGETSYSWVELDPQERRHLDLDNAAADPKSGRQLYWQEAEKARNEGRLVTLNRAGDVLLYSRRCSNFRLTPAAQAEKKYEYFVLTRDPKPGEQITGKYLVSARPGPDKGGFGQAVHFGFDTQGGNLFYALTSANQPDAGEGGGTFHRRLAIILDDLIVSAPQLNEPIRSEGQISGRFTTEQVNDLVRILRAGALPATLKPEPVSENTIGPTLGADTIDSGVRAVFWAFIAVLAFMLVYYRFAGVVACIALFANLLLTVGFMVLVNATFTLPGLAGLVLMLGMAVDANVLIYERLREERDRGASLALAIRNGYDRAFPTIIDTHLSSIFTAIVLYVVGNDQLKGFGVSLTVGLIISLFTSLYMTRLLFDLWEHLGLLKNLSMMRLLSKTNIDFMRIRYYWFTATILLTIFGLTVFLVRGEKGLNIDFTGGTLYGGRLVEPIDIAKLRDLLGEKNQHDQLQVVDVQEDKDGKGRVFSITYREPEPDHKETRQTITLSEQPVGPEATKKQREDDMKARASQLPDWSVEQIFLSNQSNADNNSAYFNVRTSEKERDLVLVTVDRLLRKKTPDGKEKSLLDKVELTNFQVDGRKATLEFTKPASPEQVKNLIEREAKGEYGVPLEKVSFDLVGEGRSQEGGYQKMRLEVSGPEAAKLITPDSLDAILRTTKAAFAARPQPERLENFDKVLAGDTQTRAMYAILASWGAMLLYLWFRFGNWTFGLAAVLCLVHDLFFTLGIIALCHYVVSWFPGLASVLLLEDFKIDLPAVAALLSLVGYSVNDTIVVFDRIREVRGKNPELTPQMINDSVNQTLSRTILTAVSVWLVVIVLYIFGGAGVHLFAFVMVVGVIVGTYSSIYIASPLLLMFGEGRQPQGAGAKRPEPEPEAEPEEEEEEEEAAGAAAGSEQSGDEPDERIQSKD
jgi:SecD/SecF fusion protein